MAGPYAIRVGTDPPALGIILTIISMTKDRGTRKLFLLLPMIDQLIPALDIYGEENPNSQYNR